MRKKILKHIFCNFICENIYFEKISGFKAPFSVAAITAAGDNFFYFFLHILIDYFFNYKRCKFQKGF